MTTIYDVPPPDEQAFLRSQLLSAEIKNEIQARGPLSFAEYMELALYHPTLGYYNAPDITIGKLGDFITAPTLTPLFAQCFARQCQQVLALLSEKHIYELGAGTGLFAADLLTELKRLQALPSHYYIYEISESLRLKQQALLQQTHPDFFRQIIWLNELPDDYTGIVIANEVLDALPCHCFQIHANRVEERAVTYKDEQFTWQYITPRRQDLAMEVEHLRNELSLKEGYQSEINLNLTLFIKSLFSNLREGIVFFIDYGYGCAEYYHPQRRQGTLSTFYKHHRLPNPFLFPGLQDITAHVDFTRVIETAVNYDGQLLGFTTQAAFLLGCGLMDLAAAHEKEISEVEAFTLHQAIKLLTLPTEMGERMKVMAIGKKLTLSLLGFHLKDRRRDL